MDKDSISGHHVVVFALEKKTRVEEIGSNFGFKYFSLDNKVIQPINNVSQCAGRFSAAAGSAVPPSHVMKQKYKPSGQRDPA